jgi:sRNA-binding protein
MPLQKASRPAADETANGPQDSEHTGSQPSITAQTKRKAQRAAGIGVLVTLMQNFPNVFAPFSAWKRLPLKIGIHEDIIAAMPGVAVSDIGTAMRIYTTTHAYLRGLIEGAERIDLAGQPAGIVTADAAELARDIARRLARTQTPFTAGSDIITSTGIRHRKRSASHSPTCARQPSAGVRAVKGARHELGNPSRVFRHDLPRFRAARRPKWRGGFEDLLPRRRRRSDVRHRENV